MGEKKYFVKSLSLFFLENKTKVILIIRDPRDVVASSNYSRTIKYIGEKKPTLFLIRNWRRSVDAINFNKENKNFMYVRYEDLVRNFSSTIKKIMSFIDIKIPEDIFTDSTYNRLVNNSSFSFNPHSKISDSVGRFNNILDKNEIMYIESTCFGEMLDFNYKLSTEMPDKEFIKNFTDFKIEDQFEIRANYSQLPLNKKYELERFDLSFNKYFKKKDTKHQISYNLESKK